MLDARRSRERVLGDLITSSGLDNRYKVDIRWPGYVSPSGGNRRVFWRSNVCPDVYLGIDTGLKSSKV